MNKNTADSTKSMPATGERLVTSMSSMWGSVEHLHRYALAMEICKGHVVLDVASGEGYGSNLLSSTATQVYGVDISSDAIDHASQKYIKKNLSFKIGAADCIPLETASVDVIVSFETIEHHDRHEEMFLEMKRVLKPGGVVLLSSPEKSIYMQRDPNNPFHIKELTLNQLTDLVASHFEHSVFFSQRAVIGTVVATNNQVSYSHKFYEGNYEEICEGPLEHDFYNKPFFNIVLCSDSPIPINFLPGVSIFSAYEVYKSERAQNEAFINGVLSSKSYIIGMIVTWPVRKLKRVLFKLLSR